jgi:hypothetical protein
LPWTARATRRDETGVRWGAAGAEVGIALAQSSPWISLTGSLQTQLAREVAQHIQRIQKTLEDANIELTSVISNIIGTSGRRMLKAMIAGETNPAKPAQLGSTRPKCPRDELTAALDGQ